MMKMNTTHCHVCLTEVDGLAVSQDVASLILLHLGKQVNQEILVCEQCKRLLQLWDDFSVQAKENLEITHPNADKSNLQTVACSVEQATAVTCSDSPHKDLGDDIAQAQAVMVCSAEDTLIASSNEPISTAVGGSVHCEGNQFSQCLLDPWTSSPPSSPGQPEPLQDPLLEDVKPLVSQINAGRLDNLLACQVCSKKFLFATSLRLHSSLKHQSKSTINKQNPSYSRNKNNVKSNKKAIKLCNKPDISAEQDVQRELRSHRTYLLCPKCDKTFTSKELLISHLLQNCTEKLKGNFVCVYCTKHVVSILAYNFHLRKHLNDPLCLLCKYCNRNFTSQKNLESHIQQDHKSTKEIGAKRLCVLTRTYNKNTKFPCSFCYRLFSRKYDAQRHMQNAHANQLKKLHCPKCNKKIINKNNLASHIMECHSKSEETNPAAATVSKVFCCTLCKAQFECQQDLNLHSRTCLVTAVPDNLNKPNTKLKTCNLCFSNFQSSGGLRRHIQKFHENRNADNLTLKYQCKYCRNRFMSHRGLKRHILFHEKGNIQRPKPSISEPKIQTKSATHFVKLKSQNKRKVFKCSFCPKYFASTRHVKKHTANLHIASKVGNADLKYECQVCHNRFGKIRGLKLHMSFHKSQGSVNPNAVINASKSGKQEWTCSVCFHKYKAKSVLKKHFMKYHMRSQSDLLKLKFRCQYCGNKFQTASGLSVHVLWFHRKSVTSSKQETVSPPQTDTFPCEFCHESLASKEELESHMKFEHLVLKSDTSDQVTKTVTASPVKSNYINDKLPCPCCRKMCTSITGLKCHIRSQHPTHSSEYNKNVIEATEKSKLRIDKKCTENVYRCIYCFIDFNSKQALDEHIYKCHIDQNKLKFSCKICDNKYSSLLEVNLHMAQHQQKKLHANSMSQSVSYGNLTCKFCHNEFSNPGSLQEHLRRIHNQANIPCKMCKKLFISRVALHEHIVQIHESKLRKLPANIKTEKYTNKDSTSCQHCDLVLDVKQLATHIFKYHSSPGVQNNSNDQDHCSNGKVYFTKRDSLYFCNFCMRSEINERKITVHIKDEHLA